MDDRGMMRLVALKIREVKWLEDIKCSLEKF